MSKWLISVPVWNESYYQVFAKNTVPAIKAALTDFNHDVRFVIHTDRPELVSMLLRDFNVETREIEKKPTYVTLQRSHAEAIQTADIDERVALLNADIVVSKNMFHSCEKHISNGKKAIVTSGIRTVKGIAPIPVGMGSRELLAWAWLYRHQIIKDLEWGSGTSLLPTNLFFTNDKSVILRGFHLHPVAILKTNNIQFNSTIDGDLLNCFDKVSIHVVTSPDDLSMLEITDRERRFPVGRLLSSRSVMSSMRTRASEMHKWLFTHRIIIQGNGDGVMDSVIVMEILKLMGYKNV